MNIQKLVMITMTLLAPLHIVAEAGSLLQKTITKPFLVVNRLFSSEGTVHKAYFLYEQITAEHAFPTADIIASFKNNAAAKALKAFRQPQRYAYATRSNAPRALAAFTTYMSSLIKDFKASKDTILSKTILFEVAYSPTPITTKIDLIKKGKKVYAKIISFGRTQKISRSLLNLLKTVVCGDSDIVKAGIGAKNIVRSNIKELIFGAALLKIMHMQTQQTTHGPNPRRAGDPLPEDEPLPDDEDPKHTTFHEKAIALIQETYPRAFPQFVPFAGKKIQIARHKENPSIAMVIMGEDDYFSNLYGTDGSVTSTPETQTLYGIEHFYLIYQTETNLRAFKHFVETLGKCGWAVPHKITVEGTSTLRNISHITNRFDFALCRPQWSPHCMAVLVLAAEKIAKQKLNAYGPDRSHPTEGLLVLQYNDVVTRGLVFTEAAYVTNPDGFIFVNEETSNILKIFLPTDPGIVTEDLVRKTKPISRTSNYGGFAHSLTDSMVIIYKDPETSKTVVVANETKHTTTTSDEVVELLASAAESLARKGKRTELPPLTMCQGFSHVPTAAHPTLKRRAPEEKIPGTAGYLKETVVARVEKKLKHPHHDPRLKQISFGYIPDKLTESSAAAFINTLQYGEPTLPSDWPQVIKNAFSRGAKLENLDLASLPADKVEKIRKEWPELETKRGKKNTNHWILFCNMSFLSPALAKGIDAFIAQATEKGISFKIFMVQDKATTRSSLDEVFTTKVTDHRSDTRPTWVGHVEILVPDHKGASGLREIVWKHVHTTATKRA